MTELLGGLSNLKKLGTGSAQVGMKHRKTVHQVLHLLGRLGQITVPVLAPEPLVKTVAEVLGSACGSIVKDVTAKR